jgi:hypothetical protein
MIYFKEFFLEYTNPHHRTNRRLTNRFGGYRNGKPEGTNIIPNRYKQEDPNFDQNSKETVGVISPDEAEELIAKHGIDRNDLSTPKRLGKRPFTLQQVNGNYIRKRI